jgi:hypothetical protein
MTLDQWYYQNARPKELQKLLQDPTLKEAIAFVQERGLPRSLDLSKVTGQDRLVAAAAMAERAAGWHDCIRMLLSLAEPREVGTKNETLEQYAEPYVRKMMKDMGTPLRTVDQLTPPTEVTLKKTRKTK